MSMESRLFSKILSSSNNTQANDFHVTEYEWLSRRCRDIDDIHEKTATFFRYSLNIFILNNMIEKRVCERKTAYEFLLKRDAKNEMYDGKMIIEALTNAYERRKEIAICVVY